MKGYLRSLALVGVFWGLATSIGFGSAANIYIAQNPVGSANGTDCANAYGVNFFNASGDWGVGAGQIGPGTTVHLCGTFTGTPGSTMLTVQGSGANGSPITIKFESGAILAAPYWSGSRGAINLNGQSYIVVDGGTNGKIENTANGTGMAYHQTSLGILASGTSNCEIKNLTISNIYVHTSVSDTAVDQTNTNAIKYLRAPNINIDHNTVHDCGWCVNGYGNGDSIHDNNIYNMCHGIAAGVGGTISGMKIYNNHFHDMAAWDTTTDVYHNDGIHAWGKSGGIVNGMDIYNNTFDGDPGHNVTAWVWLEDNISNTHVYNNVFVYPSGYDPGNGQLAFRGRNGDTNVDGNAAYNNVIIDNSPTIGGAKGVEVYYNTNFSFRNNIIVGSNIAIYVGNSTLSNFDNNVYEDTHVEYGSGNTFDWNGSATTSLSKWQSECNCDSASLLAPASQINLGPGGQLASGSVAIGAGANLTSLGIESLDKDKIGVQRPSSGPWDAGAYASGSTAAGPAPPSGLTAVAN